MKLGELSPLLRNWRDKAFEMQSAEWTALCELLAFVDKHSDEDVESLRQFKKSIARQKSASKSPKPAPDRAGQENDALAAEPALLAFSVRLRDARDEPEAIKKILDEMKAAKVSGANKKLVNAAGLKAIAASLGLAASNKVQDNYDRISAWAINNLRTAGHRSVVDKLG